MIYDLILVGLNTGMRLSEILFLKKEYLSNNIIIYPLSETKSKRRIDTRSNTKKVKFIYLNNISKKIIYKYLFIPKESPLLISPLVTRDIHQGKSVTFRDKTFQKQPFCDMGTFPVTNRDIDYVFPIKYRNPNVIFRTVRLIRERSGISDFSFHQLRHTVSTWVAAQSSLSTAKYILGHADIKTTLKYTHPEIEEQRKGVAKIEQEVLGLLPK